MEKIVFQVQGTKMKSRLMKKDTKQRKQIFKIVKMKHWTWSLTGDNLYSFANFGDRRTMKFAIMELTYDVLFCPLQWRMSNSSGQCLKYAFQKRLDRCCHSHCLRRLVFGFRSSPQDSWHSSDRSCKSRLNLDDTTQIREMMEFANSRRSPLKDVNKTKVIRFF